MTPEKEQGRRFALGRFVKNAAPPEEIVAQIIENRAAGKMPEMRGAAGTSGGAAGDQLEQIADGIGQLFDLMVAVHEETNARDKAFDALYAELNEYKNDFVYERIKPFLRSLLFVFDSIQEYTDEVSKAHESGEKLATGDVKANIEHIREQLLDTLKMVEVEMIEHEEDVFNPRVQRAVEVVAVDEAQDNKIQRVIRHGWTLGGNNFRPADVVVGRVGG